MRPQHDDDEGNYEAVPCPLCGCRDGEPMFSKGPSKVVHCRSCRLVYASVRPKESALTTIYSDSYFHKRSQIAQEFLKGQRTLHDVMSRTILGRLGKPSPGDRLLDIGCGMGKFLLLAREYGWDVEGIETSSYASAYARDSLGLDVRTGSFRAGEFPAEGFRVVTILDVVEHFYAPIAMLPEVNRILRPGGCCVITTPNIRGLSTYLFRGNNYVLDATLSGPGHVIFFSLYSLGALLRATGFAGVKSWTGEIYLKNFTDLLQRHFISERSSANLYGKTALYLVPRRGPLSCITWSVGF